MVVVHDRIRPDTCCFLRLSNGLLKLVELKPNTIIDIGKSGSFNANLILGRPYHHTFEILDKSDVDAEQTLRLVPPSELNEEALTDDAILSESLDESAPIDAARAYDLAVENGNVTVKNNRLTVDDASRQALSQAEIEELKKSAGTKEIIKSILANHSGLDEKTSFSRAKYTLRKSRKYLKRFEVLPMDVQLLQKYILDKEAPRILEIRGETLALLCAWSNVHLTEAEHMGPHAPTSTNGDGRWLVADETGGLVVAAMAESMGLLHHPSLTTDPVVTGTSFSRLSSSSEALAHPQQDNSQTEISIQPTSHTSNNSLPTNTLHRDFPVPSATNTITVLHPAAQPNLSLLKYFGYDQNNPDTTHPLHDHLKSLSYLQLLHPQEDALYQEPEVVSTATLDSWKSGKRGNYWKKRRRWERCKSIVDETRGGGFNGLVIASSMDPTTILPDTVSLVGGGGHVVVYSPTVEPLVKIMDLYSKERRTAYIDHLSKGETPDSADFPVDPRLLLAPTLQTSRVRPWQVLPGRTHPLMTSSGGAEGYIFSARRVLPLEGGVEARGNFSGRKRKMTSDKDETLVYDSR